ncbi:uncharacterized protein LOC141680525 [Apium graveolens]|uniref:uncharacterized protein LOC141680525 n=1 Tax=Apium graveolens TaxID=4045 RepID=UPI003D78D513
MRNVWDAMSLLSEWRRAREMDTITKHPINAESIGWTKPPGGWIKINVDAALFRACTILSYGWRLAAREAEALSLREALSRLKGLNYDYCIFESDSKLLVEACKGGDGVSYFHTIVSDCIDLFKHFNHVIVQDMRRSANAVAHLLATHSMSGLMEWVDNPTDFISHVLCSDIF